ncbi:LAME_0G10220g1_1 [Lachancea meyersii CBS 8951]|uniref:LAME_0G10220g1_1 n=1 Tax=Lachancea meyersii CBS 8951 TaxID=1266667 RepID=A0A1G4K8V2_9SACH|nr:LAME_0G10220g1_1 [Lachancea meyersii CBS 8951]
MKFHVSPLFGWARQSRRSLLGVKLAYTRSKTTSTLDEPNRDIGLEHRAALSEDLVGKLPEQLVSEGNGFESTTAENQIDTLRCYEKLLRSGFTPKQSSLAIELLLQTLNNEFFDNYNDKYLRKTELETQSHLFNAAESELRYSIQVSRESALNEQNLKLLQLNRSLHSLHDELNELMINLLKKDSKVDFNDRKIENTLLHRNIHLKLKDCNNKIGTRIIGDTKSDIENLRWQTTRSGLFAVLGLVFFIMSGVSISKRMSSENEKPAEVVLHTIEPEEDDREDDDDEEDDV